MTSQSKRVFLLFLGGFLGLLLCTFALSMAVHKPANESLHGNGSEGHALMKKYGCLSCHSLHGTGSNVGPALDNIGAKREAEWMARWIKNPFSIKPNSRMPAFIYLPDEQIRIIAEYLSQQHDQTAEGNLNR